MRFAPLRFASRRFPPEVHVGEVWTNGRLFRSPRIPDFDALPEEVEMLRVGH